VLHAMIDKIADYISRVIFLQRDVADLKTSDTDIRQELKDVRSELKDLTLGLHHLLHEVQRLHDRLDHETKQTRLQIDNEMLKFERRLPGTSSTSDDDDL
jgi:hypothetical protein